ncbi:4-(cytidine 5'-diphospho)-2-C-methyl-D-erythritol kinase [Oligoflexia bacterium]|nr:4-(cytidine 5'-diphospho)-2-C-methyl-D-erythritol kinase [Oligoflexia bacterium]
MEDPKTLIGKTYETAAPAKLNLRLKVTGRRSDGYHLLSMLNVTTGLADQLSVCLTAEGQYALSVLGNDTDKLQDPERNLATKAAKLFFESFSIPLGSSITIKKRIPVGGGLGGGSSDAAAILSLLQAKLGAYVPLEQEQFAAKLHQLALTLGADVPYLCCREFAHVTGIGEAIAVLDRRIVKDVPCAIIILPEHVATPEVFGRYATAHPNLEDLKEGCDSEAEIFCKTSRTVPEHQSNGDDLVASYQNLVSLVENDLENIVCEFSPLVRSTLEQIQQVPDCAAAMTGSGSALFLIPAQRHTNLEQFKEHISKNLDISPGTVYFTTLLAYF